MNKTNCPQGGPAHRHLALQSGLMLAVFMLTPNIPRPSLAFPFLLGAVSLYYFHNVKRDLRAALSGIEERWFLVTLFGFCGYLFLNSLWSLATQAALGKSAYVLLLIGLSVLVSRAFSRQPRETLERAAHFAVTGAVIGTLIAAFEFSTGHYLERMLYTFVPMIRPGAKTIDVFVTINGELTRLPEAEFRKAYDNVVIRVSSAALNRNLSMLMFLFWPALFLAVNHVKPKRATLSAGVIAVAATISILAGHSQTAQAALLLSTAAFFAARYWPVFTRRGILSAWCVAVILALPLAAAPYKAGLHTSEWIASSFRDRMIIWDFTVEQAVKTPWLGIGLRSTRVRGKELKKTRTELPGHVRPRRLSWHSHNHFLQVWLELGAAGAIFLLALGIGLLRAVNRMEQSVKPYAYAAFVSACVVAAFGWGLWQSWLLSGYALTVMLVRFIGAYADRETAGAS